jgi:hypothetical protein
MTNPNRLGFFRTLGCLSVGFVAPGHVVVEARVPASILPHPRKHMPAHVAYEGHDDRL